MSLGKPDAGKPPVRFDEGRSKTVMALCLSIRPLRLLYSKLVLSSQWVSSLKTTPGNVKLHMSSGRAGGFP